MNPTTTWCDADEEFFRVIGSALPPEFLYGAGALLASYDED